jgi:hypothetical protein
VYICIHILYIYTHTHTHTHTQKERVCVLNLRHTVRPLKLLRQ